MMRVFYSTDHDGHYPVGIASIVVAPNEDSARVILSEILKQHGLNGDKPFTLTELNTTSPKVLVLRDGDY